MPCKLVELDTIFETPRSPIYRARALVEMYFDAALLGQEDVEALDVPMDDVVRVQVVQPKRYLVRVSPHLLLG